MNSRIEAVYIRDEMLKLHTKTGSLRRPLEVVRFLEDEISKGEKKLVRFPDLCLNAADKSAILVQAVSVRRESTYCMARQAVGARCLPVFGFTKSSSGWWSFLVVAFAV